MFGVIENFLGTTFAGIMGDERKAENAAAEANFQAQQSRAFNAQQATASQNFNSAEAVAQRAWADAQGQTTRDWTSEQAGIARGFNAEEAQKQRDYEANMSNTAIQRRMQDLTAAGINPLLAVAGGGASQPHGASAQIGSPTASAPSGAHASAGMASSGIANPMPFMGVTAGLANATQAQLNKKTAELRDAEIRATDAETKRREAETGEIGARTPTHAVNIQATLQGIHESESRITKIIQETETSASTAQNLQQQTRNLQATLPVLEQTVNHLRAMTTELGTRSALNQSGIKRNDAEIKEISQRIKANLPALEAALQELRRQSHTLELPRQEMQSAVEGHGFIGALGATLRAINPFTAFIPGINFNSRSTPTPQPNNRWRSK